eukprot:2777462-Rhodomonas_salina.1
MSSRGRMPTSSLPLRLWLFTVQSPFWRYFHFCDTGPAVWAASKSGPIHSSHACSAEGGSTIIDLYSLTLSLGSTPHIWLQGTEVPDLLRVHRGDRSLVHLIHCSVRLS